MPHLMLSSFDETEPEFSAVCNLCEEPFVQDHPYLYTPGGVALCVRCAAGIADAVDEKYAASADEGECTCGDSFDQPICRNCLADLHKVVDQAMVMERHLND